LYAPSNRLAATVHEMAALANSVSVAVLGAAGTIAPAIVRDLAESEEVPRMVLLDLDGERAAAVASEHGGGKATAQSVDARDADGFAHRLEGVDVLLNTASYRVNLEAMRACLVAGCHYLDLGGLYWMTRRQFELSDQFERDGLVAVLGLGSSPGKTNLMARRGVDELGPGESIESVEVVAAGRDLGAKDDGKLHPPYAIQTLLDELTLAPVVLRDGAPVEIEPLAPGGEVEFGDPIGRAPTIYTLHSELATFGESFGCRTASFRLSLAAPLLERLERLVGASAEEVSEATAQAAPQSAQTVSVHLVIVTAASGASATVRSITRPHFGLGGGVVSTATPPAAAVRLLARGAITARGALPPERCIDPAQMFAELEARGVSFSVAAAG
jgi:Saccharopine dehydrogenase NADP binding domain